MRTRSALLFGLSAAFLPFALTAPAQAQQRGSVGQQIQRQVLNNVQNSITGQPNNPYQATSYNAYPNQGRGYVQPGYQNQPWQSGYQNQPWQPGYQRQPWAGYSQPGAFGSRSLQQGYVSQPSGVRYRLPAQYNGWAPGSALSYGGANYVVNPDGTMSPAAQAPIAPATTAQRYQIPAQYAGTAPGSTISYGGANYAINADNTMSPTAGVR